MMKHDNLFHLLLFSSLLKILLAQRGRFGSEIAFVHCLCGVSLPYRMEKLQCMEQYVPAENTYRMYQSVQYCGYFANKTNFGQTVRQRIYIPNYNPWEPAPDLNTEIICGYTKIRPGNAAPLNYLYVTGKGWVISKCILNMAGINAERARFLLRVQKVHPYSPFGIITSVADRILKPLKDRSCKSDGATNSKAK